MQAVASNNVFWHDFVFGDLGDVIAIEDGTLSYLSSGDSSPGAALTPVGNSPASPTSVALSEEPWQYRGEGGANLVLSLTDRNIVVRFSKSKYEEKDKDAKIRGIAHYANKVIIPLFGVQYVRPVAVATVSSDADVEHVRMEAQRFRPQKRLHKNIGGSKMTISHDCAFLTENLKVGTGGDTFCIEIKPKGGWRSQRKVGSRGSHVGLCHLCLKQRAKLWSAGSFGGSVSRYCPLDLFSGDAGRMKKAIFDLAEDPQNRFKFFKNGRLVYAENEGDLRTMQKEVGAWLCSENGSPQDDGERGSLAMHRLAAVLCTVLTAKINPYNDRGHDNLFPLGERFMQLPVDRSSNKRRPGCDEGGSFPVSCDATSLPMPEGCILDKLLSLQKRADLSSHEAKLLCDQLLEKVTDMEELQRQVLWHFFDPDSKTELLSDLDDCSAICSQGCSPVKVSGDDMEAIRRLQRFLLSMTASDVSLMLTFRRVTERAEHVNTLPTIVMEDGGGQMFRFMVSVVDLDPKPVHRIKMWADRQEEWEKRYFDSL